MHCKQSDDFSSLTFFSKLDTLLNNITGELVLGEVVNILDNRFDHDRSVFLFAILNDVLNDIVAELVRNQ